MIHLESLRPLNTQSRTHRGMCFHRFDNRRECVYGIAMARSNREMLLVKEGELQC